ncbi:hypothetical protein [uncultured Cohaesibacter sp.]|uniref:hypothetical protein n=1 Tax=uncultured Cohaesibacter sp. TaxID=1002546 RepID=UPI0029C912F8|nr:hypothetical protein [uncultured Cohaesibacter sp.]
MNTQTHLLISAFALARPGKPLRNIAVLVAAFLPDAPIFGLVAWAKMNDVPERDIWRTLYWQDPWQTLGAVVNSIPLYGIGLIISALILVLVRRSTTVAVEPFAPVVSQTSGEAWSVVAICFFLSCLLHIAFDFPFHVDDAHRHFWPISDWRFRSPVSYWNRAYHGDMVEMAEMLAGLALVAVLFFRFSSWWVRAVLGFAALAYVLVPLYWALSMAG